MLIEFFCQIIRNNLRKILIQILLYQFGNHLMHIILLFDLSQHIINGDLHSIVLYQINLKCLFLPLF